MPVLDGGASSRSLSLRDVIANTKYFLPIKTTQPFTPLYTPVFPALFDIFRRGEKP